MIGRIGIMFYLGLAREKEGPEGLIGDTWQKG
jgi:hypothetical protein